MNSVTEIDSQMMTNKIQLYFFFTKEVPKSTLLSKRIQANENKVHKYAMGHMEWALGAVITHKKNSSQKALIYQR